MQARMQRSPCGHSGLQCSTNCYNAGPLHHSFVSKLLSRVFADHNCENKAPRWQLLLLPDQVGRRKNVVKKDDVSKKSSPSKSPAKVEAVRRAFRRSGREQAVRAVNLKLHMLPKAQVDGNVNEDGFCAFQFVEQENKVQFQHHLIMLETIVNHVIINQDLCKILFCYWC